MSNFLYFSEHTLQEIALVFMAIVYSLRLRWLFKFKGGKERQAPTGAAETTPRKGIIYSWGIVGMPWAMESTRTKLFFYSGMDHPVASPPATLSPPSPSIFPIKTFSSCATMAGTPTRCADSATNRP